MLSVKTRKHNPPELYVVRVKQANEAQPTRTDLFSRPIYKTGDGDIQVAKRPGSLEFLKCKSRSL